MWVLVGLFVLFRAWIISFFFSSLHIFVILSVLYALVYRVSRSWRDGTKSSPWFRELSLWDSFRTRWFSHSWHQAESWQGFEKYGEAYLFIVHPQCYGTATLFSFGLHGKPKCPAIARLSPLICLSPFLFYIPILSELLQLAGGVTGGDVEVVKTALDHKQNIVWYPGIGKNKGMMRWEQIEELKDPDKRPLRLRDFQLDDELFNWISEYGAGDRNRNRINIVPVYHHGEWDAYYAPSRQKWLDSIQTWCHQHIGYEFPLVVFGWMGSCFPRKCTLSTSVGSPIPVTHMAPDGSIAVKSGIKLLEEYRLGYAALLEASGA